MAVSTEAQAMPVATEVKAGAEESLSAKVSESKAKA